jgi:hypothetical protein
VVESSAESMGEEWDWPRFIEALSEDETVREAVRAADETHKARIIGRVLDDDEDYYYGDSGDAVERMWTRDEAAAMSIDDQLKEIAKVPDDSRAEVFIMTRIPKEKAVEAGAKIADRIADLMRTLLPVYAAAVV